MHIELRVKTHPSWHGQCLSCMVIASVANIVVVLTGSVAIILFRFLFVFSLKLETEDQLNLKYRSVPYHW